jgi:hypothetical protein
MSAHETASEQLNKVQRKAVYVRLQCQRMAAQKRRGVRGARGWSVERGKKNSIESSGL